MPRIMAGCPNHDYKQPVQKARGEKADLAIIEPHVPACAELAGKYLFRIGEIQSAFCQRDGSFSGIKGGFHNYYFDRKNIYR